MTSPRITVDVHLTADEWTQSMVEDCASGLIDTPKHISPVWFYDKYGSELFDAITRLEEYYPTRAERSLLTEHATDIVRTSGADTLVELGSGTSDKTRNLLDAMALAGQLERYIPFDVSEHTVRDAASLLVAEYPGVDIHAVIGDFHRDLGEIPDGGRRLFAFLGGTLGNLVPAERDTFLADLAAVMDSDDWLLLGVDLVKDPEILVRAYDDPAGVTAEFNRNALEHINRQLAANFDPEAFEHVARWNESDRWIEMWLRSTREQTVDIEVLDLGAHFAEGEEMRTEISAKFTQDQVTTELRTAGFTTERTWVAEPGFLLLLARRD